MNSNREVAFTDILIGIDEESDNKLQELTLNTIFKLMYAIEKNGPKNKEKQYYIC